MPFLHLMRHGKSESAGSNPKRPLSHYGIRQVHSTAALIRRSGRYLEAPTEILHSPKERARETAALVAQLLGWTAPLREHPGLDPDAQPESFLPELAVLDKTVCMVGHLPFMPILASLIIPKGDFSFGEATFRCFEKSAKGWKQEWFVEARPPDPRKGE